MNVDIEGTWKTKEERHNQTAPSFELQTESTVATTNKTLLVLVFHLPVFSTDWFLFLLLLPPLLPSPL